MAIIKENFRNTTEYMKAFLKWVLLSVLVGLVGGVLGSVFHLLIDYVTELRVENGFLLYFLPVGGLLIAAMYHLFSSEGKIDTNRVILSVRKNEKVPLVMIPLIFISTVITHMLGGSAGREGAALQLGGSIGYNFGRLFRLNEKDLRIIIMTGMGAVFAALFGTPLTAAIFAIEVITVGVIHYGAIVPCVIASLTAYLVSGMFGLTGVRFAGIAFGDVTPLGLVQVALLALLCAVISILFCFVMKKCEHIMDKLLPNRYLRVFLGGLAVVVLSVALGTRDYNGAGMDVITRAMGGDANWEAFLLKIIFTAITISAGFKGGEIVPAFFIGSTFGCVVGPLLGLDASFAAAIGFTALFCGVVNCPIASIILSIEVFGVQGLWYFALACAITYMMSGYYGLYHSQKIMHSKIDGEYIDIHTK